MIRDHVENFEIPSSVLETHSMEAHSLDYLHAGLTFLYQQMKHAEQHVNRQFDPGTTCTIYGNSEHFKDLPMPLLACSFHWYAVSCCNWLRLCGFLRRLTDTSAPNPNEYVRTVVPEVLVFRNKVAAHFARADDRDNYSEQIASVLPPVSFHDGTFCVGLFAMHHTRGSRESDSTAIRPWSLTKVHESLTARFSGPQSTVTEQGAESATGVS